MFLPVLTSISVVLQETEGNMGGLEKREQDYGRQHTQELAPFLETKPALYAVLRPRFLATLRKSCALYVLCCFFAPEMRIS